jgi:hypothetical protein
VYQSTLLPPSTLALTVFEDAQTRFVKACGMYNL